MPDPADASEPSSPLAQRDYRELWSANAVSNFGGQVQVVGAGWLMATLTTSPQLIALVQTAISLPTVFFILLGGALADNFNRRSILLTTQTAMLLVALILAVCSFYGLVTPLLLLALIFTTQSFNALNNPSWQASVRDLLPRRLISRAVALNSTSINLARTAGPALGGAIVALAGVSAAFLFNALSFVGFVIALLRWKPEQRPRKMTREPIGPAILIGIRYAAFDPNVRHAVIRGGLSGISASAVFALLPVLARHHFQADAFEYGLLLACFGGGAVVSAFLGGTLRNRFTPDAVTRTASVLLCVGLAVLGISVLGKQGMLVAGIGAALGGAGWTMAHSTYNTTVQLSAAPWVTARSLAFYQTATFAGMSAGSALFGYIAGVEGLAAAFMVASAAQAAALLLGFAMPLPRLEDLHVEQLDRWQPPQTALEIAPEEGPVRIAVDYIVKEEDWPAFRAAMQARRRIRNRDGANSWTLWQDAAAPEHWVESYRVANWAEYVRHNQRRTEADLANTQLLDQLSIRPEGERVRRFIGRG